MSTMAGQSDKGPNIPLSPRKSPMPQPLSPALPWYPSSSHSSSGRVRSTTTGPLSSPRGTPSDRLRIRANSLNTDCTGITTGPSPFRLPSAPVSPMLPFVPSLSVGPPSTTAAAAAANAAFAAAEHERARIKQAEKDEETMDADQLRLILKKERAFSTKLAADLAAWKSAAVSSQAEAEAFEEGRINCLMRKLDSLSREKGRIIVELEREEEMLTNTMQKKLDELRKEKAMLERQIDREHAAAQSQHVPDKNDGSE